MSIPKVLAPTISKEFQNRLRNFDPKLQAVFNCQTERFEIYRHSKGRCHWILEVSNEDESYRSLDNRVIKKLWRMDIIARYGSVANYEKHLDEKQKLWREKQDKKMNHELRYDIKDNKRLWQRAAENLRSGIINDPPEEKERKIISCSK